MSFATSYASLVGAAKLCGLNAAARSPQADYDATLRAAQNPRDRALRLAREARFAAHNSRPAGLSQAEEQVR